MKLNDFIEKLTELFEETATKALTADTKFRELEEWSSLTGLILMAMMNEEYDVHVGENDIRNSQTIGDLFALVNK